MIDNTKFACKMIENKKLQNAFVVFFAIMLVWLVGRNIPYLCTVLELGDEAGYLGNAAYFTGYDWNDIRTILPYYGYGYSVLLIPAFLNSSTNNFLFLAFVSSLTACFAFHTKSLESVAAFKILFLVLISLIFSNSYKSFNVSWKFSSFSFFCNSF